VDAKAPRRIPVQARSQRRYDAILDGGAALFATQPFDAVTMEAIAERAQTSIGSVYQFFPNKLAVFEAVAERCLERSKQAFDGILSAIGDDVPAEALIDGAIDAFVALNEHDPAFRATVVNFALYGVYEARDSTLNRYLVRRVAEILGRRAPGLPARRAKLVATVVVQLVSAMMFTAERGPRASRAAIREETKLVVRRYVTAELAAGAARRPLRKG
jgi:AcrR family transcriptional regulator